VLTGVVAPLLREQLDSGVVRTGYFVRYADPQWHVRLRLAGEPARLLREALPALREQLAPFVSAGVVHRLALQPYVREVTRYGGSAAVLECEEIFRHDSLAALAVLERATGERGLDARWRFVMLGMDRLMRTGPGAPRGSRS
jgi:thiopeptide-type bacteriocin biosynthesis protein